MQRWMRWAIVLGAVAVLAALPALIASRPVSQPDVTSAQLVDRIRASAAQPYQGLFESRGGLALPDVGRYADLVAPFAETTRVRVWYAGTEQWRADALSAGGEIDWYRSPDGVVRWDSDDRRITSAERSGEEPLRVARPMDLSPSELGRRVIHEASTAELTAIGARRIAGRTAAGLRITPASATTTIRHIDLWADPTSGVVLRVEVDTGGANPILESGFLDVSLDSPPADVITFPAADAAASGVRVRRADTLDPIEQLAGAAVLIAPATAAVDLPPRSPATFGADFAVVVVGVAPGGGLSAALNALAPTERPWGGEAALIETPLLNVELATIHGIDYVIGGTVTVAELDRLAALIVGRRRMTTTTGTTGVDGVTDAAASSLQPAAAHGPGTTSVVCTNGLTKTFRGGLVAVDHIDLDVREGDLFGFLGPNGAGKTTTIRMLLGLVHPTSGEIELLGERSPAGRHAALAGVGTLVEGPAFYPYLSGERNLQIYDAAGRDGPRATRGARVREVIERVGLGHVGRKPVKAYSLGMRQRLGLAAALMRAPRLLILDEPTNGLDAQGIHELRTMFVELVTDGTTIMLSSHLLAEVELICTRAAMMSAGRIVVQDTVSELLTATGWVRLRTPDGDDARQLLGRHALHVEELDGALRVQLHSGSSSEALVRTLVEGGVRVSELVVERRTLEDVFLDRTAGEMR